MRRPDSAIVLDMGSIYRVNEIFYSLQGEGFHTGRPAIFLRMSGCNRSCGYCDTDHSRSTSLTAEEIVKRISAYPARFIVVTGGEPLLQLDSRLIGHLKKAGMEIAVETNGSLPVPDGVDWVSCSPKDRPWRIDRIDELKIVFDGRDVEEIAAAFPSAKHLYLQPCYDALEKRANTAATVEYIKQHPKWRLSLQTHRLIDIP